MYSQTFKKLANIGYTDPFIYKESETIIKKTFLLHVNERSIFNILYIFLLNSLKIFRGGWYNLLVL